MARREIPRIYSFTPDTGYKPKRRISLGWSIGLTIILSLVLTVFVNGFAAHAETAEPGEQELINVVFDGADIFTPEEEEQINLQAKRLIEEYGTAMAVETVATVNGKDMESWTVDRANERLVGAAELNNGLFYGIAVDDREFYVAKGDGYAAIPDYKLQEILDGQMVPRFKEGNFAQGVIDSSESFGQLAASPDATKDTRAVEEAATGEALKAMGGQVLVGLGWLAGIGAVGGGGFFTVRTIQRRKQRKIEAAECAERERIEAERRRIAEEARQKRVAALNTAGSIAWGQFADLPNGEKRHRWLMDRNIYAEAFGIPNGIEPDPQEKRDLEKTISETYFGGIPILGAKSVRESEKIYEAEQERLRIARAEAEKKRREEERVKDEARQFWRGMSNSDKREFSRLSSERDRQRWISDHGGSNIFGLHPAIAIAMFVSLSSDHTRAEARAAEASRSSSTDYSSSSSYSSSSMFGGGSFGGGGGAGGSW